MFDPWLTPFCVHFGSFPWGPQLLGQNTAISSAGSWYFLSNGSVCHAGRRTKLRPFCPRRKPRRDNSAATFQVVTERAQVCASQSIANRMVDGEQNYWPGNVLHMSTVGRRAYWRPGSQNGLGLFREYLHSTVPTKFVCVGARALLHSMRAAIARQG